MICRYYLTLNSDKTDLGSIDCLDVSSLIANLGSIRIGHVRKDLGGVVVKLAGATIEFVGTARERLVSLYTEKGLGARATFAVYGSENDWRYSRIFECPLNFASFEYDESKASCGCLDGSASAVIKAKNGIRYEFPVTEIMESLKLEYDGLQMQNDAAVQMIGATIDGDTRMDVKFDANVWWWFPRVAILESNIINNRSVVVSDQEEAFQTDGPDSGWNFPAGNTSVFFLECMEDTTVSVDFSSFYMKDSRYLAFVLFKLSDGKAFPLTCGYSNVLSLDNNTKSSAVKWSGSLAKGDKLQYAVFNHKRMTEQMQRSYYLYPASGTIKWYETSDPIDIDVISPSKLLDRILLSMSEDGERIYGGIKPSISISGTERENSRLSSVMLAAAESIRNFPDAKIYTSFRDFCSWMEATFGYVYEIADRTKPSGGFPEYIVANSYDFSGFTDLHTNITSVDSPNTIVHFSTTDKCFVGVVYESALRDTSASFPGSGQYQEYADKSYKVHTDRYYHDTAEDVYYYATVEQKQSSDTVSTNKWYATLHECVLEGVDEKSYEGTRTFGGIMSDYETDSGTYNGYVNVANIRYVRKKKIFVYENRGMFYSTFRDSSFYNLSNRARNDTLFFSDGYYYIIMGTSLARCSLSNGGTAELVPFVYFRHRDELFSGGVTYKIPDISGFRYKVSGRMYSQIQIGYGKQDYDLGNNGKDEFNFTSSYTTGNCLTEKKLAIISPYRADCYGFEELAEKRGEELSSTDSDTQIFALSVLTEAKAYKVDRRQVIDGVSTRSMFNANLSPVSMIEANSRYLASFAKLLKFASMDGCSDVVIDGRSVKDDVTLTNPLFGAGDISFETDRYTMPDCWNGVTVEIEACGRTVRGYLDEIQISADKSEVLRYNLIESF